MVDKQGRRVDVSSLGGRSMALYFAGEWCPMCRGFTPKLKAFMEASPDKAIVFVSSDFSREDYEHHLRSLGDDWLSVPYGSDAQSMLKAGYRVWGGREAGTFGMGRRSGLPTLVVIDPKSGKELRHLDAESKGASVLAEW